MNLLRNSSTRLAIIDGRSSKTAINTLSTLVDDVLLFNSSGIVIESISGHPDIFIFKDENGVVVAPNAPFLLFDFLDKYNVFYKVGESYLDSDYKKSCFYNCCSTVSHFFHKKGFTDKILLSTQENKIFVALPQAFTRCSMLCLPDGSCITSDVGIVKALSNSGIECFLFDPSKIKIFGHKNGLFGGTCGMLSDDTIVFNGSIYKHEDGIALSEFLEKRKINVVCLNDDFLYDGGSILFL